MVRDPLPAGPVRRRHVAARLDRRLVHELRLRLGVHQPVRKVFYNLTITGLSVAVALIIGTIELGGLLASQLNLSGAFWNWFENINVNFLGFVIVGLFVATWAIALSVWRFGHIEERWTAHLREDSSGARR